MHKYEKIQTDGIAKSLIQSELFMSGFQDDMRRMEAQRSYGKSTNPTVDNNENMILPKVELGQTQHLARALNPQNYQQWQKSVYQNNVPRSLSAYMEFRAQKQVQNEPNKQFFQSIHNSNGGCGPYKRKFDRTLCSTLMRSREVGNTHLKKVGSAKALSYILENNQMAKQSPFGHSSTILSSSSSPQQNQQQQQSFKRMKFISARNAMSTNANVEM